DYARFAEHIQQQRVDIWIAPLLDTPFNRAKSAIKSLEYSPTASPGVYSRIDPYEAVIRDGENGFLAASDVEWVDRLGQLVQSAALRRQMGGRALETVRANWLLSQNYTKFSDGYRSAACRVPGAERYTSPQTAAALHMLDSGSRQMIDRLDQLSYLEKALSENRLEGASENISAADLFQLLRNAQVYGAARDAEISAVRSSTTYRLASVFGRAAGLATQLLKRARGIISDPSQKGPAE
nr:glycosyltransferase [Anaerolinea sp.]